MYTQELYQEFEVSKSYNKFEEVIDSLILSNIEGIKQEHIDEIMNEKLHLKRMSILMLLDKNYGIFKRIHEMSEKSMNRLEHITEIVKLVREYVTVGTVEKKKFGEVMTPISLVEEMLDTLPSEVWSNPNLKWLDPANGVGVFPCVIVLRLMEGLAEWEPDTEKRYKHIVENMLYACELQAKNMFLYLYCLDNEDKYKMNIYTGSFLDEGFDYHMKTVWGVENFDIVVGNPPFNSNQIATGKRGGGDTLWDKFVMLSAGKYLVENGYLVFVHPTLWRKPQSNSSSSKDVNSFMFGKQIHFLKMYNTKDGMNIFKAGTRFDYYLLENCDPYKETFVVGEDRIEKKIKLWDYNFLPNYNLELFDKIRLGKSDLPCKIIFNVSNYETRKEWVNENQDDVYKYPLIHSTPKSGTRYMYSSRNDIGHFGIPKIIFGDSGIYEVVVDIDGKYGMTQHSMAIEITPNLDVDKLKSALSSDAFKEFLKSVTWSNFQIDWRLFMYLKSNFYEEFVK